MQLAISEYRPGIDDSDLLALRSAVWGSHHPQTHLSFFEWLYRRSPAGTGTGVLLHRGAELVGFAGLSPRLVSALGKTLRVAHGLDFMVHPDVGKVLSGRCAYKLASCWAEIAGKAGYELGFNYPNNQSIRLLTSPKLGWQVVLSPQLFGRPLRTIRARRELPKRIPEPLATFALRSVANYLDLVHRPQRSARGPEVFEPTTFDHRFDNLWRRVSRETGGICRDSAYLNWRYLGHPIYKYRVLAVGPDERIDGFMATSRREVFGLDSVLIVDWAADPYAVETVSVLIENVISHSRQARADFVGALASPGSTLASALRRAGFLPVPRRLDPKPFFLTAKALTSNVAEPIPTPFGHWSWGDMDVV